MKLLSRRQLLTAGGPLLTSVLARGRAAGPSASVTFTLSLAHQFNNSSLRAISSDGTKLCFEDWKKSGHSLRVIEVGTWKTLYEGNFQSRAFLDFFADGQALFLDFPPAPKLYPLPLAPNSDANRLMVVELRTGDRTNKAQPIGDFYQNFDHIVPLDRRTLLVAHYLDRPRRAQWFSRVDFYSGQELARVELAERLDSPRVEDAALSADRKVMVYFINNAVVCRNTDNLGLRWTHPLERGLRAEPIQVSARGDYVFCVISSGFSAQITFQNYIPRYFDIYDGITGADVARLPIAVAGDISLSPDGRHLAAVVGQTTKGGAVFPIVHVYDASSGALLASVVQDGVRRGRHPLTCWSVAPCGSHPTTSTWLHRTCLRKCGGFRNDRTKTPSP